MKYTGRRVLWVIFGNERFPEKAYLKSCTNNPCKHLFTTANKNTKITFLKKNAFELDYWKRFDISKSLLKPQKKTQIVLMSRIPFWTGLLLRRCNSYSGEVPVSNQRKKTKQTKPKQKTKTNYPSPTTTTVTKTITKHHSNTQKSYSNVFIVEFEQIFTYNSIK